LCGCLLQPQCILIVEHCLEFFLLTSCQKDLVPEFCKSLTLYRLAVFYLTKAFVTTGNCVGFLPSV